MIDFPDAPVLNDLFTVGSSTWQFDGTAWRSVPANMDTAKVTALLSGRAIQALGAVDEITETASVSTSKVLDTSVYNSFDITMTGDTEFSFTNPAPSGSRTTITVNLKGAFIPSFPGTVVWSDPPPSYTGTGAGSIYTFTTTSGGSMWFGSQGFA